MVCLDAHTRFGRNACTQKTFKNKHFKFIPPAVNHQLFVSFSLYAFRAVVLLITTIIIDVIIIIGTPRRHRKTVLAATASRSRGARRSHRNPVRCAQRAAAADAALAEKRPTAGAGRRVGVVGVADDRRQCVDCARNNERKCLCAGVSGGCLGWSLRVCVCVVLHNACVCVCVRNGGGHKKPYRQKNAT